MHIYLLVRFNKSSEGKMLKKIFLAFLVAIVFFSDVSLSRSNFDLSATTETNVTPADVTITTTNVLPASNSFAQSFKVKSTGLFKSITISTVKTQPQSAADIVIYLYELSDPANITSYSNSDSKYLTQSDVVTIAKNKTENDVVFTFSDPKVLSKDTTYLLVIRSASNQFSIKISTNNTYFDGQLFTNSSGSNWSSSNDKDMVFSSSAKIRFEATFDANGGTPDPDAQDVLYGDYVSEPTEPTKEGYDFCGWYNGETLWDFETDTIDENGVSLTACWELSQYTITYNLDNGTNSDNNPATYTFEDEVTFSNATKLGYTFNGWYSAAVDGTLVSGIVAGSTGNVTIYASFSPRTNIAYTVKHYVQTKTGEYVLHQSDSREGTTNTTVVAEPHQFLGFTFNADHNDTVDTGTVSADGSLVLHLYYARLAQELEIVPEEAVTESKIEGLDDGIEIPELEDEDVFKVKVELVVEVIEDEDVLAVVDEAVVANNYNLLKVLDLNLLKTVTYFDGTETTSNINRDQIKKFLTITLKLDESFIGVKDLKVAYVSDDGSTVEFLDTVVFEDEDTGVWYVSFETNHFSYYALVNPQDALPQTSDNNSLGFLFLLLGGLVLLGTKKTKVSI